jgi:hypothetical protein
MLHILNIVNYNIFHQKNQPIFGNFLYLTRNHPISGYTALHRNLRYNGIISNKSQKIGVPYCNQPRYALYCI